MVIKLQDVTPNKLHPHIEEGGTTGIVQASARLTNGCQLPQLRDRASSWRDELRKHTLVTGLGKVVIDDPQTLPWGNFATGVASVRVSIAVCVQGSIHDTALYLLGETPGSIRKLVGINVAARIPPPFTAEEDFSHPAGTKDQLCLPDSAPWYVGQTWEHRMRECWAEIVSALSKAGGSFETQRTNGILEGITDHPFVWTVPVGSEKRVQTLETIRSSISRWSGRTPEERPAEYNHLHFARN